jgi:hypothetical protein
MIGPPSGPSLPGDRRQRPCGRFGVVVPGNPANLRRVGRNTSAFRSSSRTPPSHASSGSQFVSNDVVHAGRAGPFEEAGSGQRASLDRRGSSRPNAGARPSTRPPGARPTSSAAVRPDRRQDRSVRARRSDDGRPGREITGRRRTLQRRPRVPASSSSMKRPNGSSPTTPWNATRRPSRAAPQAKIADELPTVIGSIARRVRPVRTRALGPRPSRRCRG